MSSLTFFSILHHISIPLSCIDSLTFLHHHPSLFSPSPSLSLLTLDSAETIHVSLVEDS